MIKRARGNASVVVLLAVMCLVEAFALQARTLGVVLIGIACGLALIVLAARADMRRVALGAAYLCAFTLTWNGWFVGPVRPGDVLVLITLLCFAIAAPATSFRTPPWWVKQLVFVLLLGALLFVMFPPSPDYLVHRQHLSAGGQLIAVKPFGLQLTNIGIAVKFIIAVAAIPMAFTAAALVERRAVHRLGIAFAAGAALSGLAAFIDHLGIASVGEILTGLPNIDTRQVGFADHPNFLAAGLVLAIPFACWMLVSHVRWEQRVGLICLLSMLGGVFASGSRGGAVCSVGALFLALLLLPRTRPHMPTIVLGALTFVTVIAAVVPSFGHRILHVTRLSGDAAAATAGSDEVRSIVGAQGMRDFYYSPFHGIGLQASTDASQVYIQELASGGLVLFLGMSLYMIGAAWAAFRFIPQNSLAAAILASVGATLALNLFEADLTDRFYYVPEAILIAMLTVHKQDTQVADGDSVPPGRLHLPRLIRAESSR
ncbi:MAG: O-antigen ligase family protein [Jatrophihabitans sp.]|uniref:O-antigen ligase family protein n=1 Tax=Jatrophihabitans sp. TaxID=1932789 RepID=UPI00390F5CAB